MLVLPLGRIVTHHSSSLNRGSPLISFRSFLRCLIFGKATPSKMDPPSPSISSYMFLLCKQFPLQDIVYIHQLVCLIMFFSFACGFHEGGDLACHSLCCLRKPEKPLAGNSLLTNTGVWVDEWMLLRQYHSEWTKSKEHLVWFTVPVLLPSTDSDTSQTLQHLWDEYMKEGGKNQCPSQHLHSMTEEVS